MASELLLNGRYRLLNSLGMGGMAVVYKAQDLSLGRLVAVKILRDELTHDAEFLVRFQQEARAAANLAHPNIVTVHDYGNDGGRYYIVMEYVEGKDLKTLIKAEAPFKVERAVELAIQICAGVGYAHRAGLVHCDIKPQNILVTADGRVKITDFGIARALTPVHPGEITEVVWGSPQYYSPEQAAGEAPTPASDVYSIGVVMFEMLAGRPPFMAARPAALAMMHIRDEPPRLSLFNRQVPPTLEHIVHKVLAKEPSARYRTADQLGRILISFREQGEELTAGHPAVAEEETARSLTPAQPLPDYVARAAFMPPAAVQSPTVTKPADSARVPHSGDVVMGEEGDWDWVAVGLGFLAFISVAGLLILWTLVYLAYTG